MFNETDIEALSVQWDVDLIPYIPKVKEIGDICAIRYDKKGRPFRRDYERGLLLILVALKHKLVNCLEFGTGRGFVSACLSMLEGVDSVHTIDKLERTQTVDVMSQSVYAKPEKVTFIQTKSNKICSRHFDRKFDLIFIDGEHTEKAVKADFNNALLYSEESAIVVFDDFRNKHEGVKRFIKSLSKYRRLLVSTDGWYYQNARIHEHGDADKIVNGREFGSGQVILIKGNKYDFGDNTVI